VQHGVAKEKAWYWNGWFIELDATFNNISVTLWWSVLLVEETGEKH
jgi:hypothetical protein